MFCKVCDCCEWIGNFGHRDQMPQTPILSVEIFDVLGIDLIWYFPSFNGCIYILIDVDYVSKWLEAKATKTNDSKVVIDFVKSNIFPRFGTPKAIIRKCGLHFCNRTFWALLKKYHVNHGIATSYHPLINGEA